MVAVVSTGAGALWLLASLFLLLLVTIVIATGDSIDELEDTRAQRDVADEAATGVEQQLTTSH